MTIDPRFTRTSAVADRHMQIRPGSDIAVLGGLIRHTLENDLYHADYVRAHTNASFIVGEPHLISKTACFQGSARRRANTTRPPGSTSGTRDGYVRRDRTLQHPRCVFPVAEDALQSLHPRDRGRDRRLLPGGISRRWPRSSARPGPPDRVGTIMYAVGWTMHTVGSQIIRTAAILQLLLGNIGRPGGGINALRGHANVQGATDHAIVAGILPGYLKVPAPSQHVSGDSPE